jgi:hypothetical protein
MPIELQQQFSHPIPTFSEYGYAIANEFKAAFPKNGPELILEPSISLTADTDAICHKNYRPLKIRETER